MWKFIEDLKNDFKKGVDDIGFDNISKEDQTNAENEAFERGKQTIKGNSIVALQDGTVEMVNQDQDQIEIYMDNGEGYGVKFPFGPTAYSVKVSPNQKVKAGETLVTFGPDLDHNVRVYAFTPDIVKVLTNSRFRIN